ASAGEVLSSGSNAVSGRTLQAPYPLSENIEGSLANWDLQTPWGATNQVAHGGTQSLTDSPNLPYDPSADVSATTVLSLGSTVQPYLRFWERHSLGSASHALVQVSTDGSNWTTLADLTGYRDPWQEVRIDLSDWR